MVWQALVSKLLSLNRYRIGRRRQGTSTRSQWNSAVSSPQWHWLAWATSLAFEYPNPQKWHKNSSIIRLPLKCRNLGQELKILEISTCTKPNLPITLILIIPIEPLESSKLIQAFFQGFSITLNFNCQVHHIIITVWDHSTCCTLNLHTYFKLSTIHYIW